MTALDVIRDIAEYSRPDALSRILADSTEVYELVTDINARTELGDEILIALARGEDAKELIEQFRDEVDRELEDKAQAEVRRHI